MQQPLDRLLIELVRCFERMTLDEVTSALGALSQPGDAPPSLDAIARNVIALPVVPKLREAERAVIAHAMVAAKGNVSAAARLLGVDRKALERKLARHKLPRSRRAR